MKPKYTIQEDDCDPDAREYFEKGLKEKIGISLSEFKENGILIEPDELTMQWYYQGYVLEYSGDDPYYRVYRGKL